MNCLLSYRRMHPAPLLWPSIWNLPIILPKIRPTHLYTSAVARLAYGNHVFDVIVYPSGHVCHAAPAVTVATGHLSAAAIEAKLVVRGEVTAPAVQVVLFAAAAGSVSLGCYWFAWADTAEAVANTTGVDTIAVA